MSDYRLYILRCADDTLYTGITVDVPRRLEQHESGTRGARYLRGRSPFALAFDAAAGDRSRASRLEYRVKRLARKDKERLIAGQLLLDALLEDDQVSGSSGGGNTTIGALNSGR